MNFSTAWKYPSLTGQDSSIGSSLWTLESQIFLDDSSGVGDNSAKSNTFKSSGNFVYRKVSLVKAGLVRTSNNEAANQVINVPPDTRTFGGASDMWGDTMTVDEVNANDFGVAVSIGYLTGITYSERTAYLLAMGFDFNVPDGATIVGVETKIDAYIYNSGGGTESVAIDYIQARVHYTWDPVINAAGVGSGFVYTESDDEHKPKLQKRFRHKIFEHDGAYLGDWKPKDIASDPSFKREVNNLISTMPIALARNELYMPKRVGYLLTESDTQILTEDDQPILVDQQTGAGLGVGTDTDVNHDVEVDVFYGEFEPLLTEDGLPITTQDDRIIMAENGAPQGRSLFSGYINYWELLFGEGDENITTEIMSHSQALDDIMLETEDTAIVSFTDTDGFNVVGIKGSGPTDRTQVGHTFTMVGTKEVSGLSYKVRSWGLGGTERVTMTLKVGAPGAAGATLAVVEVLIPNGNDTNLQELRFPFDEYITLTNAVVYGVSFEAEHSKTGGNEIYPVQFEYKETGGYSGGQGYEIIAGGSWVAKDYDLWFKVWEPGGDTTVTFNSLPPDTIAKKIIDFARSRGWRGNYEAGSIEPTNTIVSIDFKANTCLEALNKIPDLCPDGWFQTYDPGRNIYSLKERPATPERYFTKGKNVNKLRVKKSISELVNQIYFSGGDVGGGVNLFKKYANAESISSYRRGLSKLSDNRVTDADTAEILSQAEIDRLKEPMYSGSMVIIDNRGFYIEDIELGLQGGFINFGALVDSLGLQLRSIAYNPDVLVIDLNSLPPKLHQRVEDIRRALALIEQQDNPTAPS